MSDQLHVATTSKLYDEVASIFERYPTVGEYARAYAEAKGTSLRTGYRKALSLVIVEDMHGTKRVAIDQTKQRLLDDARKAAAPKRPRGRPRKQVA